MQQHGSWQYLEDEQISPLQAASVLNGDSDYRLHFDPPANDADPLGFLVANQYIRRAIFAAYDSNSDAQLLDQTQVTRVHTDDQGGYLTLDNGDTLSARLVVAADTRFSSTRNQMGIAAEYNDYGRSALLCVMEHERPHHHTALECFLYGGTLAVLPLNGQRSSIVITVNSSEVPSLLALSEEDFNREVEKRLAGRLGAMQQVGERYHYPLVGVHAQSFQTRRFALIGDAAVGMHPVTAHGFNLGLSGQDLLAKQVLAAVDGDGRFWTPSVLRAYQRQHMPNTRLLYHGTNTVVGLFTDDRTPAKLVRNAVLHLSNHLPPLKQAIRHKLMHKPGAGILGH